MRSYPAMKRKRSAGVSERIWWLEEEVVCAFCFQLHPRSGEARCEGCDREVCLHCVVVRIGEVVCPQCEDEPQSEVEEKRP